MNDKDLTFKEKKIDAIEFAKEVHTLPYKYREKIYYMIEGYKLLSKAEEDSKETA